jgi:PAS domain S-box-containing protein
MKMKTKTNSDNQLQQKEKMENPTNCFQSEDSNIFQTIFENSPAAIAIIEADATVSMVNNEFCKISGYSKDELIGANWTQKMPPIELDQLKEYNRKRLINKADAPNKYEFTSYTKDGELRYGLMSVSVIESLKKTIITFTDITDRKMAEEAQRISEERFRSFIEYANDVVYSITPDGIFTYSSPNWTEKLGHDLDSVIGHSFADFVHPNDVLKLNKIIKENFETGEKINNVEYQIKNKDGQWRWYTSSSSPIIDQDGKVTSIIGISHDITEQKQAKEALQRSETLLKTLVQTIPDLIWLKDTNGVYLSCNKMFERFFGASETEIVGKTDYDFVDRELADSFRKNDRIAIEKGGPSSNEEWITFADDGHRALLDTLKTPMYDHNGELIGILSVARDITKRKLIEEALAESEFFFKESQRAAFIGSYKANFITGYWESSEVLDSILGINKTHIRGVNEGWLSIIHPDDREKMEQYMNNDVILKHNAFDMEYRIIRKSDGVTRWVNGLGKVILDSDGNVNSLIGTIQDITERKLAEQVIKNNQSKLSLALKIAHLGSWEYDIATDLFTFNDSFYAIYRTSADRVGGYTMSSRDYVSHFVHPEEIAIVRKEIKNSIETNNTDYSRQIEHRILYDDGEIGYITVHLAILRDEKGKIIKTYGINQDVSARIQAEKELKESEAQLLELNATKDKFFSIIAHDLRNPIASLLGLSEIMATGNSKLSVAQYLQLSKAIYKTADSTYHLLENLLEWSRLQRGSMPLCLENIVLKEFFYDIDESAIEMARKKEIKLTFDFYPGLVVTADSNMLHSIVRNLITNAIKFTKAGGFIQVKAQPLENDTVLFSIEDSGIGMNENMIDNLFRIDINVNRPGTNDEPSTGLGLIICKEFVEKHSGKIWAESKVGKGSTFFFTIKKCI